MKQIKLSKRALRILSLQLQQKGEGFTIKQIRQLDKVLDVVEPELKEYDEAIEKVLSESREKINKIDKESVNYSILFKEVDREASKEVEKIDEEYGVAEVKLKLEDSDFDFLKEQWTPTKGLAGNKSTRKVIIAIDDAIENPEDAGDSQKEEAKKNGSANGEAKTEDGGE